ncbi:MAG: potassium channel family protein [Gammaproteobacteria bacterium]|nr:potassium channel family protein [Gammaproteobacteria bacterium]
MNSLILASIRLMRAIHHAYQDPEFRALLAIMLLLLMSGTIFYVNHEGWSYVDALYFCVTTMSTVGYGDLTPTSNISKIFTVIYTFISIGVFVGVAAKLANAMLVHSRHLPQN